MSSIRYSHSLLSLYGMELRNCHSENDGAVCFLWATLCLR